MSKKLYFGKAWKRTKINGTLDWSSLGIVAYSIPSSTPVVPKKGQAFIIECHTNSQNGDIMISKGGMKEKRVVVEIFTLSTTAI